MRRVASVPSPLLVTAWLWIGLASLMLLFLRAQLSGTESELVRWWAWRALWLEPSHLGISVRQAWLAVNSLFAFALWLDSRSALPGADHHRRLTVATELGTVALLLLLHWAFLAADAPLPRWQLIRIHPPGG